MKNKKIRMTIDISMTVLLPMLMAYSLIGEKFHEIAGTAIFALFIAHNIMNRGWYKALFRGRYTARRAFQTVLNSLLLILMILQPVSGILMSKHLYSSVQIPGVTATVRAMHLCLAYWCYTLMSLHAGTHLTMPLRKLKSKNERLWKITSAAFGILSAYGCFAFVKRSFADYMFLRAAFAFFDFGEARILFFIDYIAIMILFAMIGCLITSKLSRLSSGNDKERKE